MKYLFSMFLLLLFVNAFCETFEIKLDGTGDFTEIQAGINTAVDGDTVLVYPGTYIENINFNGKDITVGSLYLIIQDEQYVTTTIIDGDQNGSVVTFENGESLDAILTGFTIQNGCGKLIDLPYYDRTYGGGIYIDESSPSLSNLIIENNTAQRGGGIYFDNCDGNLISLTIRNNYATEVGGGLNIIRFPWNSSSNLTFDQENRCSIYLNFAADGNDIYIPEAYTGLITVYIDTLTVLDFDQHFVSEFPNLDIEVLNSKIEQVESDLYVSTDGSDENTGLTIDDPLQTITWALTKIKTDTLNMRNIYLEPGRYSPSLNSQFFPLNFKEGLGLIGSGSDNTILDAEEITQHIYIRNENKISITGLQLINGYSEGAGAISSWRSDLSIRNVNINNNIGHIAGGLSIQGGVFHCKNIILTDNHGWFTLRFGKYFERDLIAVVENIIVANNEPLYELNAPGGGIAAINGLYVKFVNSLVVNNTVYEPDFVYSNFTINNCSESYIINSTICNNNANYGGAVSFEGPGTLNLINSIVYGNEEYQFHLFRANEPSYINIDYSLIDNNDDFLYIAGPEAYAPEIIWGEGWIREDPQFVGGDESDPLYYQLSETSPCINTGIPDTTGLNLPEYDPLGNPRIWDDRIDMGCYEYYSNNSDDPEVPKPTSFKLCNYPNPFNPAGSGRNSSTTISFYLSDQGDIQLNIYSITGQLIRNYTLQNLEIGYHEIVWDGKDSKGSSVASGIYLYKLNNDKHQQTRKMILLK